MQLPLLNQQTLVQQFAAAAQANVTAALDFTVGAVWRAVADAQAGIALWLQYLAILILGTTRAATSSGADLDSWMADWSFVRLPAVNATGQATLSRYTATIAALVVPGVQLKTADGSQVFTVTTDTTNSAWSTSAGAQPGYFLPAGNSSVTVPVQAAVPGAAGNIQPGTLTLLASSIPGLDYASNATAFTNGINAESDAAFRSRFAVYIEGLRSAIPAAIESAAEDVQQGVRVQLASSVPTAGFYTLYADDGSGAPPQSFIQAITTAVQAETAEGVQPIVMPPTVLPASVAYSLQVANETGRTTSIALADAALTSAIAALGIGQPLGYLTLPGIIIGSDPNITGLNSLTLNGGTANIGGALGVLVVPGAITGS